MYLKAERQAITMQYLKVFNGVTRALILYSLIVDHLASRETVGARASMDSTLAFNKTV